MTSGCLEAPFCWWEGGGVMGGGKQRNKGQRHKKGNASSFQTKGITSGEFDYSGWN